MILQATKMNVVVASPVNGDCRNQNSEEGMQKWMLEVKG